MRTLVKVIGTYHDEREGCDFYIVKDVKTEATESLGEFAFPKFTEVGHELMIRTRRDNEDSDEKVLSGGYFRPSLLSKALYHLQSVFK